MLKIVQTNFYQFLTPRYCWIISAFFSCHLCFFLQSAYARLVCSRDIDHKYEKSHVRVSAEIYCTWIFVFVNGRPFFRILFYLSRQIFWSLIPRQTNYINHKILDRSLMLKSIFFTTKSFLFSRSVFITLQCQIKKKYIDLLNFPVLKLWKKTIYFTPRHFWNLNQDFVWFCFQKPSM